MPKEKPRPNATTPKTPATGPKAPSPNRPFACPYEGCGKAYIHEYKLKLHLRKEHVNHDSEENGKNTPSPSSAVRAPQEVGYSNDVPKKIKRERQEVAAQEVRPQKILRHEEEDVAGPDFDVAGTGNQWASEEEDSEETEDDGDSGDDEETEDED